MTLAVETYQDLLTMGAWYEITSVGLRILRRPTLDEWTISGVGIRFAARVIHFAMGDWMLTGELEFGEDAFQELDAFDYADTTLATDRWVCSRIPLNRRREGLSWSHHVEVAPLDELEQEAAMDQAEAQGMSVRGLRDRVREVRGLPPAESLAMLTDRAVEQGRTMRRGQRLVRLYFGLKERLDREWPELGERRRHRVDQLARVQVKLWEWASVR